MEGVRGQYTPWLPPLVSSILRWVHLFIMDDVICYFHKASVSNIELLTCAVLCCVMGFDRWLTLQTGGFSQVLSDEMLPHISFLWPRLQSLQNQGSPLCPLVCDKTCTYREATPRVSAKIDLLIFVCPLVCEEIWLPSSLRYTPYKHSLQSPMCLLVCEETWPKTELTVSIMLANIGLLPCVYVYWCVMRFDRWLNPLRHFLQTQASPLCAFSGVRWDVTSDWSLAHTPCTHGTFPLCASSGVYWD